ncbi:hypothetical protein [Streptomyces scabiei]|uniref:hypothetical protein n=1 Tax=Streptomyces scabiei TaxID=1930 RepID=UPI000765EC23|nr:hypothetical protein [Streptomyces scabiei]
MAVYQRGAGDHVAERVQPEPGSDEEQRLDDLVARGEGGWHRVAEKETAPTQAPADKRPAKNAVKDEWVAYARTQAKDSDEEAMIDGLTKDELIELYGGES